MDVPTLIHFYSPATGVSLELPPGFENGFSDERSAQYEWRDDEDEEVLARLVVLVFAATDADAGEAAVRTVVEAFADADGDLIEERVVRIDDCPTATVVVHLPYGVKGSTPITGPGSADVLVHFTAAAFDGAIRTISGFAPWVERDRWTAIYDEAVGSCRFL
ncbi:hypothetical protein ABIB25_001450 [Nakamurella sp. UYEF19]|uniref:hypothetical protein n=1 Tax=Nakamurella sp. UYEF19 TaxID=1756392 RepID=UPI003395FA03